MLCDLLAHIDGGDRGRQTLLVAIDIAKRSGALLSGLHVTPAPDIPAVYKPSRVAEAVAHASAALKSDAREARATFEAEAVARLEEASWLEVEGDVVEEISARARFADLVILSQGEWQTPVEHHPLPVAHSVVLRCGRPVLVVPDGATPAAFAKVALAWDGSREAVRAIHDALPFLKTAKTVHLLTVYTPAALGDDNAMSMIAHLARHGVAAESRGEGATSAQEHRTLQASIQRGHYDLLVMGAYSHSKWVEYVFGGATQSTLLSSDIPVLVSH